MFTPVLSQFSSAIHSPYVPSNSCINHKLCPVLSIQCVCGILNNRTLTIERLEQDIQIHKYAYIDLSRHWKKDWHAAMLNERLKLTVEIMAFPFCHVALHYMHSKWSSTLGFAIVEYTFICSVFCCINWSLSKWKGKMKKKLLILNDSTCPCSKSKIEELNWMINTFKDPLYSARWRVRVILCS